MVKERKNYTVIKEIKRKSVILLLAVLLPAAGFIRLRQIYNIPKLPETLEEYMELNGHEPISFSCASGVYEEEVSLEMKAAGLLPKGAVIRYTLDGLEPTQDSAAYSGAIRLTPNGAILPEKTDGDRGEKPRGEDSSKNDPSGGEGREKSGKEKNGEETAKKPAGDDPELQEEDAVAAEDGADDGLSVSLTSGGSGEESEEGEEDLSGALYADDNPASGVRVFTVRTRIFHGEEKTDVQYGVFCVGKGLFPVDGKYIVCVDTDEVGLYDYDIGILVTGRIFDEHDGSKYHANFMEKGEEWVRPCHVTIFDGTGKLVEEHNAGLSVSGGMSRRLAQKSLNLSFGEPYGDPDGHLLMDIFSGPKEADCAHVGKYTHLRLRARSQVPRTFRETLAARLGDESGARATTQAQPGIVFLNGSFYTLAELEPSFSNSLLSHRFDLPDTDNIEKKKGKEKSVLSKMNVNDLFEADLTIAENRAALEEAVDMDDYLLYYAVNVLENNLDWPRNNVEAWRYTGEYDPECPYTDGRLRFVLFDSDKAYNTNPDLEKAFGTDTFVSMMENIKRGFGSKFRDVMAAEPYRDRFVTILCDLMNTSFDTEHVLTLMREICDSEDAEYRAYFIPEYMEQITADQEKAMEEEAEYNTRFREDLYTYFGLTDMYDLSLYAGEGVTVSWNNMLLAPDEEYSCAYYKGVSITCTAAASPGWRFDHWEINGEAVESEDIAKEDAGGTEFRLTVDGSLLQDGRCTVSAVAVPEKGERLIIAEVSAAGTDDWIRLYNAGTTKINLGKYCISDDPDDIRLYRIPSTEIYPGESCIIACNKYTSQNKDIFCRCSFSLSRGETLYLTPDEGMEVPEDSLRIPYMSAGCSYGRKKNGAVFRWFDRRE